MKKLGKRRWRLACKLVALMLTVCTVSIMLPVSVSSQTAENVDTTGENTVTVLFASTDIKRGTKFTEDNIELRTVKNVNIPSNALNSIDGVVGKYANADIYEGEYISLRSLSLSKPKVVVEEKYYVNVAEYVKPNTGRDVSVKLQRLIDQNTNKTLYFPDGEYLISKPLKTYGAASKAVSIILSDGAVIKASNDWQADELSNALIASGVRDGFHSPKMVNDVASNGSYYTIQGGTFDGNGRAYGISLDGGRETLVKNVHIKNVPVGIFINVGINGNSSDMDIDDVVIECDGSADSVGIRVWGFDNTISNTRIYDAQIGVEFPVYYGHENKQASSAGNSLHNVSVYYTHPSPEIDYSQTKGISESGGASFYYHCYVENYCQAYFISGAGNIVDSCTAAWTSGIGEKHVGFKLFNKFRCCMSNVKIDFFDNSTENIPFEGNNTSTTPSKQGAGFFETPRVDAGLCDNVFYDEYFLRHGTVWTD